MCERQPAIVLHREGGHIPWHNMLSLRIEHEIGLRVGNGQDPPTRVERQYARTDSSGVDALQQRDFARDRVHSEDDDRVFTLPGDSAAVGDHLRFVTTIGNVDNMTTRMHQDRSNTLMHVGLGIG